MRDSRGNIACRASGASSPIGCGSRTGLPIADAESMHSHYIGVVAIVQTASLRSQMLVTKGDFSFWRFTAALAFTFTCYLLGTGRTEKYDFFLRQAIVI